MTHIGYTLDLVDDLLTEIEVEKYKPYDEYFPYDDSDEKISFYATKWKIKNFYDLYGNKINYEKNIYIPDRYIIYVKGFTIGLENLRAKIFFNCNTLFINNNLNGDYICTYYYLYKKKENLNINFSGVQNIYDNFGRLIISFFHNNGNKQGEYKICIRKDKNFILNFIDDIQIGGLIK